MKNLLNLKGVKTLGKIGQKAIHGGKAGKCSSSCVGKPIGVLYACYHNNDCGCPGVCTVSAGCQPA